MLGWIILILLMLASLGFVLQLLSDTSKGLRLMVLLVYVGFFIFVIKAILAIEN
jgi:hypothetical protein